AEDGIRDFHVTGVQTCALPILRLTEAVATGRSTADFEEFLERYRTDLRHAFHVRANADRLALQRGVPPHVMRHIRASDPFVVYVPKEYGGRGGHIHEGLA